MDRNKPGSSRSGKTKVGVPHHASELFALGSKSSSSRDDAKNKVMSTNKSVPDRKREGGPTVSIGGSSGVSAAKKPKLSSTIASARMSEVPATSSLQEYWEQVALDSEAVDLVNAVLAAIDQQDSDKVVALVCGAIKALMTPRAKPDSMLSLSLLYLAKIRSHLFCNETICSALVSIFKRDINHAFKGRSNPTTHVLAANLLARGHHNKPQWPESFIRIYIEDAINDRVWVDYEDCQSLVENICTGFGTKIPPKSMLQPELNSLPSTTATPSTSAKDCLGIDDDSGEANSIGDTIKSCEFNIDCPTMPRYSHISNIVEKLVLDAIKELLPRRQAPDTSTRNLLRFLSATSGLSEIRSLAVQRLELWLHNGKLMKPAQELLTYICYNVSGQTARDHEVLSNLVKMRLKTKPLINIYMNCLKEMIGLQPSILYTILKYVVQNELSNARNPNNMGILASMFQTKPEESAKHLAEIYQEFLLQREDYLRTLRVFLRELVKMLRFDIKLTTFCNRLLSGPKTITAQIEIVDFRDRIFYSLVDLVCLCMFLSVSPQIKEANVSLRSGRDNRGSKVLLEFYEQMTQIQCDALKWMYEIVPVLFKPNDTEFSQSLHKLLFLEAPEQYSKGDQWPPDQHERSLLLRLVSEIPIHQDSILAIIIIGITKDIPFKLPDAMEVIETVIRRAASLKIAGFQTLEANKLEIIDFLFTMSEYRHPENIALPVGYEPPKLAISSLYWKAWNILLMLSAHNPSTFGAFCWDQYPMLRTLMEMCITNQFVDAKQSEEELQVAALERTQILEFETHLAAATSKVIITEQNSLLLSQLMLMDPMGVARRPPPHILEQLQAQNSTQKLGHLLCRNRKPDLLLDIIQRQGSSQSMPWLADLVQNSEGDFNHLPVQCLCEFLLSNSNNISLDNSRDLELLAYLQNLLIDENGDHQTSCEVLEYFLRRLASSCKQSRQLAIKGLRLLLKVFHKEEIIGGLSEYIESDWLLRYLPLMPYFPTVRLIVIVQLRAACQIENNPELVMIYIQFIAANTLHDTVPDMLDHVMDMSQLIVERTTVFSCIIPNAQDTSEGRLQTLSCLFVMFNNYLIKLREHNPPYSWPEYPDLLMVHFSDGSQLPIHLNIIQAFVILLTYSSMIPNSQPILDYWFPIGSPPPQAFTIDTSESIQILPDWLKLKMIRSSVDRLVDAALIDLMPDQIVLFVQNFGTPVSSMSKLLALLDRAVIEQFETVKSAILNTAYLAQLIEIQQTRGAKNGHIAVQALELHGQILPDPPKRDVQAVQCLQLDFSSVQDKMMVTSIQQSRTSEIEESVDIILRNPMLNRQQCYKFRKLMQQLIAKDVPNKKLPHHLQIAYGSTSNMQQYVLSKVLYFLHRISIAPHGTFLFQNLFQKSTVCSLFRSLLTWIPDAMENYVFLIKVMDQIIQSMNPISNPVLFQILLNKRKMYIKTGDEHNQVVEKHDLIQVLHTAKLTDLEKKGKKLLNELLKQTDSKHLVDAIISALRYTELKQLDTHSSIGIIDTIESDQIGLLVDWLSDIDSELVSTENNQMNLLFSRSLRRFRFYMLSLLSHHSSWQTLHSCLLKLLQSFNENYDPSSVLHFIGALIHNPKLWQGRDKATPKHEQIEYIINMNWKQIQVFTDYTLKESESNDEKLTARVDILLKCVVPETFNLKVLVNYVRNHSVNENVKKNFLQQLYLNIPPMKFLVPDLQYVYSADAKKKIGCRADVVTNYTLTAISSLTVAKDYQTMSQDMELHVRKLAASHPSLILRQLSVLAALLQGRAHMDIHVLRSNYHIPLFNQVLGILELLQPQLFEEPYKDSLHQALECYFTLLRHHGRAKDIYHLMVRFMELLQSYTNINANCALNFIEPYADLIQDLAAINRNVIPLQQLVQGVSLLKHRHTHDFFEETHSVQSSDDVILDSSATTITATSDNQPSTSSSISSGSNKLEPDSTGAAAVILAPFSKQHSTPQHWPQLVKHVLRRNGDEILAAIQEIEVITAKRQGLLEPLFERLLELLVSPIANVRYSAHILLTRHLKANPGNAAANASALTAYIQCLQDSDSAIVTTALEILTEMVICLQEHAVEILKTVFDLGIQSKQNTLEPIRKCLLALKTQHAC